MGVEKLAPMSKTGQIDEMTVFLMLLLHHCRRQRRLPRKDGMILSIKQTSTKSMVGYCCCKQIDSCT